MRGAEVAGRPFFDHLGPEATSEILVVVPYPEESTSALAPGIGPLLVTGARPHLVRGDHRPRGSPEEIVRRVEDVRPHGREQGIAPGGVGSEDLGDEVDAGLATPEGGHRLVRGVAPRQVPLVEARRGGTKVDRCRRRVGPSEPVERQEHPGRTEVDAVGDAAPLVVRAAAVELV